MRWGGEQTPGLTGFSCANKISAARGAPIISLNESPARGVNSFSMRRFVMSVSPDLLEILRCPACKSKVELKHDGSGLKCVSCRRVYPIRDEIPVMLVDEAVIEEEDVGSSLSTAS
jgi:uncharacterized protein YbaR (Trm112 family)